MTIFPGRLRTVRRSIGKGCCIRHEPGTVTRLLLRWRLGDQIAADELTAIVYPELRQLARSRLVAQFEPPLSPTELVHEAFLRLSHQRQPEWVNRSHFFFIAGRLMRQVLVDFARERQAVKRGEGRRHVRLERIDDLSLRSDGAILALHDAIEDLGVVDPRKAEILEMRYFGGMTAAEIGEALGIAAVTVSRDLRAAKAWLRTRMESDSP